LKEIAVVLKPFDPVTKEISAEKAITASKIIMLVRRLTTACNKIQPTLRNELATTPLTSASVTTTTSFWLTQPFWIDVSKRMGL